MDKMNLFDRKGESSKASFRDNKSKDMTSIEDMFAGCESLTQLDPSRSKVKDMIDADMKDTFVGCESLTQSDPSRSKAEDMTGIEDIFSDCKSLT